jgi:hypothetical protein
MAADPLEGKTGTDKRTGQRVVRKGGQWVPLTPGGKPPVQEASMRSRMDLGLAPMMSAHQRMVSTESKGNPFALDRNADNAAAKFIGDIGFSAGQNQFYPFEGPAKSLGGKDYQDYEQSAAAFEAQLMPIMSGAAVSPSEARRQIKASLPALGDSPEILAKKGKDRERMLNGAAKARGLPLPFPNTETWGINTTRVPDGGKPADSSGNGWKVIGVRDR